MGGGHRIALLGRVEIGPAAGDQPAVRPRGRRTELVFAYLAAEHHRLVTHDEMADALWPDRLPDTWEAGLRGVLTEVRRLLADGGLDPSALTTARGGHQLSLPADVTVDLDDARGALAAARDALAAGTATAAAAAAAHAATLARLPFLPNHESEWVTGVRRELEALHARALDLEARARLEAGDLGSAATAAERLVAAEPFSEPAHQLRIRILAAAGDRAGALRAFEHCRALLAEELGVEPSEETVAIYRAAVEGPAPPPPAPAPPEPVDEGLGGLDLLVVEDHDFQRRTAVLLLGRLGVRSVAEAADGLAALELLRGSTRPDIVLCDINMPGMDGVEFIRHVAERELAGAVIIASALDAKVVQAVRAVGEGYGLQVLGALEKPLTARALGDLLGAYRPRPRTRARGPDHATIVTAADAIAALRDGTIRFLLRPGVEVATGAVTTADVVPVWTDAAGASIPSAVFLPLLGRQGQLGTVAQRGLVQACADLTTLAADGLDLTIGVTLTPDGLHDPQAADRAEALAQAAGADPSRLTVGLDERAFRNTASVALGVLTRLRVKGFGVALTGFGAAGTPAEQLSGLPLTEVTLSAALVTDAGADPVRSRTLEEVIDTGHRLGVPVVGDGCESAADLQLLLSLGCDRVQGPFVADPQPGAELAAWVAAWDPGHLMGNAG